MIRNSSIKMNKAPLVFGFFLWKNLSF